MNKTLAIAFLLGLGVGCSKQAPATTTTTTQPASGVQLGFAEMKLIDVNKDKAVLVHADGTIEIDGEKPAKVTADGKIIKISTGEVGLTLNADGTMTKADGTNLDAKLAADGTVTTGDKSISIGADGELIGGNPGAPKMKIEGATDAKLKRTAMFVLVALTAPGEVKTETSSDPNNSTVTPQPIPAPKP